MNDPAAYRERPTSQVVSPAQLVGLLSAAIATCTTHGTVAALLVLDLRRLDRFAALTGDERSAALTAKILERLTLLGRPQDRIAAATCDEIWLFLPELPHCQLAVLAANRILDDTELRNAAAAHGSRIRPCIGIAWLPDHASGAQGLIEAADWARRAAASSETRYSIFEPSPAVARLDPALESELRSAINANALEVHYQPQIELKSGQCRSAEALIRWNRVDGRRVAPALIAEVAESGEDLHAFTIFVVNTALRHALALRHSGPPLRLSVNLSAKLMGDDELPGLIAQLLEAWSVPPAQLTFEVTESSIVRDIGRSVKMLKTMKALGIRLAMDDFGTGYSSLAHLKLLPFDELKIDQIFVRNMLQNDSDLQIVRAMIDLGHNFGMEVVAEGAEDEATLMRLKELNCDFAQGNVIATPMPLERFDAWRQQTRFGNL